MRLRARTSVVVVGLLAVVLSALPAAAQPAGYGGGASRLAGDSRIDTAVAISGEQFPDGAAEVFLARADVFADAVAGGALTAGPTLLVPSDGEVPPAVVDEVARLGAERVTALGGEQAVSDRMLDGVADGLETARLAGEDRFGTAVAVAGRQFPDGASTVHLARADQLADAVSAGSLRGGPVLLVPSDGDLPEPVVDAVAELAPATVVALGGTAAVADEVLEQATAVAQDAADDGTEVTPFRYAGESRIATSVAVAGAFGAGAPRVFLARADEFPDAVAGGSLTAGPTLLVPTCGELPLEVAADIVRLGAGEVTALGGEEAICDGLLDAAAAALVGPDTDTDDDGVPDAVELRYDSDPTADDTDDDGLSDRFEIVWGGQQHRPDTADSDEGGTDDAASDVDGDGLSAAAEQDAGSDPLNADTDDDGLDDAGEVDAGSDSLESDTDGDGLDDGAEVEGGTEPTDDDSDGDGTGDADETRSVSVGTDAATVELTGLGDLADALTVTPVDPPDEESAPAGLVGTPVDITFAPDSVATALRGPTQIALPYDADEVDDPDDLGLFFYDELYRTWTPAGSDLTVADGEVTATVTHLSRYAVFNVPAWEEPWQDEGPACATRTGADDLAPIDVVFLLDGSGSNERTDPDRLRVEGAKLLNRALLPDDRRGVVEFAEVPRFATPLTTDADSTDDAIDAVGQVGGTDLTAALDAALDVLDADERPGRDQVVVMLSDGVSSPPQPDANTLQQAERAAEDGVRVFTIAFTPNINTPLLNDIAETTDGASAEVYGPAELPRAFRSIDKATTDLPDGDGDGLADCEETGGMRQADGARVFTSDPDQVDTDGDGIPDGVEVGQAFPAADPAAVEGDDPVTDATGLRYPVFSDPEEPDGDGDGAVDATEFDIGADPLNVDSDGDGLLDGEELAIESDPTTVDTDGDGAGDAVEDEFREAGVDPLDADQFIGRGRAVREYVEGFLQGLSPLSRPDADTIPQLVGQLDTNAALYYARGAIPSGIAPAENLDDSGSAARYYATLDPFTLALGAPLIDGFVDGQYGGQPDLGTTFMSHVVRYVDADDAYKGGLLRAVYDDEIDRLTTSGALPDGRVAAAAGEVGDENLLDLSGGRTSPPALVEMDDLNADPTVDSEPLPTAADGEESLADLVEEQGGEPTRGVRFDVPSIAQGPPTSRVYDLYDEEADVAYESRVGTGGLTPEIRNQLRKDEELLARGDVSRVEWHFYPSTMSGKVGLSAEEARVLTDVGVVVFVHLPSDVPGVPAPSNVDEAFSDGQVRVGDHPVNMTTDGLSEAGVRDLRLYGRYANSWLAKEGTTEILPTQGELRADASAAAADERDRAEQARTPYGDKVAGHVPDTAVSGQPDPPAGWLAMDRSANSKAGGVLGSRVGQQISHFTIDGELP